MPDPSMTGSHAHFWHGEHDTADVKTAVPKDSKNCSDDELPFAKTRAGRVAETLLTPVDKALNLWNEGVESTADALRRATRNVPGIGGSKVP